MHNHILKKLLKNAGHYLLEIYLLDLMFAFVKKNIHLYIFARMHAYSARLHDKACYSIEEIKINIYNISYSISKNSSCYMERLSRDSLHEVDLKKHTV